MSETSDEEVDDGPFESIANPPTDLDQAWSTSENDKSRLNGKGVLIRMGKSSKFIFSR